MTFIRYGMPKSPHIPWGSFAVSWQGLDFYVVQRRAAISLQDFWRIGMLINTLQSTVRWVYISDCKRVIADHNVLIALWLGLCQDDIWWGLKPGKLWHQLLEHIVKFIKSHLFVGGMQKKIIWMNQAKIVFLGSTFVSWSFSVVVWPLAYFPEGRLRWNISQNQLSTNWIVQGTVVLTVSSRGTQETVNRV